jgi:diphthamide synthase (EF-2-diphthine--ammonia ligase)
MIFCAACGFPLGTRPGLLEKNGACQACINSEAKKTIDFEKRQRWLTRYIAENKTHPKYDCLVAVSGGKDSHAIVKRLYENHGVRNALLVSVTDEFTHTKAGQHNINNLVRRYNCDHILVRCEPETFRKETLKDFENELHPLKWIEERIYSVPIQMAKDMGIKLVFYGENSAFEYGTSEELDIFHPATDEDLKIIFMGAIYPYSISDSLNQARAIGFKDLDDFGEWPRQGSIDQYTQIDSVAYIIQLWTKYVKFGFQRVADVACRFVREGLYSRDFARELIDKYDYICDPAAKADFCQCIGITEEHFDTVVARHANTGIVEYRDGAWHAK